ncbi:MAG: thiamine-phosphate kinase [Ardenticatenaceae bacterium]
MRISEMGEFSLIEQITQIVGTKRPDILVGIGDDVAVLADYGEELLLATIDSQVEGGHFVRDWITPRQLGRRLLAINLSDIAAMGGRPQYALISLALPADTEVAWVEELYRGLREEADRFGVAVIGGNMATSPAGMVLDLCLLGRVTRSQLLLRSGARPGDKVLVTGQLGNSAAGLKLLLADEPTRAQLNASLTTSEREMLLNAHFTPTPRVAEAQSIAHSGLASAMLDISDGLSSDIGHICDASQVGVRLWANQLPISSAAQRVAEATNGSKSAASASTTAALRLALAGGEDYELCFTAPAQAANTLKAALTQKTRTPTTIVGQILPPEQGRWLVLQDGRQVPLDAAGWQHFAAL